MKFFDCSHDTRMRVMFRGAIQANDSKEQTRSVNGVCRGYEDGVATSNSQNEIDLVWRQPGASQIPASAVERSACSASPAEPQPPVCR